MRSIVRAGWTLTNSQSSRRWKRAEERNKSSIEWKWICSVLFWDSCVSHDLLRLSPQELAVSKASKDSSLLTVPRPWRLANFPYYKLDLEIKITLKPCRVSASSGKLQNLNQGQSSTIAEPFLSRWALEHDIIIKLPRLKRQFSELIPLDTHVWVWRGKSIPSTVELVFQLLRCHSSVSSCLSLVSNMINDDNFVNNYPNFLSCFGIAIACGIRYQIMIRFRRC